MYGHLIPHGGGKPLPLAKTKMYLGRGKGAASAPLNRDTAYCQLELVDGWWHIEDLRCPGGVRVNGGVCKRVRLNPNDEITIKKYRYRIDFEPPKYLRKGEVADDSHVDVSEMLARKEKRFKAESSMLISTELLGRLVPLGGGKDFPLLTSPVTIGRRPPCDIVLQHATVSSTHCRLELIDGYWQIEDLDSRNGITVDGVPRKKAWVYPQSRLCIAKKHRYRIEYEPSGDPPPDDEPVDKRPLLDKLGLSERATDRMLAASDESHKDENTEKKRWDLSEDL